MDDDAPDDLFFWENLPDYIECQIPVVFSPA